MDADTLFYKGYEIRAVPNQLRDSGEWTVNIQIWRDELSAMNIKPFSATNSFPTREEAVQQCFWFGRKIIDGEIDGCSVLDL